MNLDLKNYSYEWRKPTDIQQCIKDLIDGHPTAQTYLYSDLQLKRHIERNPRLLQWPLVRFQYAKLLLNGCLIRLPDGDFDVVECGDKERGMAMMLPLAEEGLATAQFEIGWALRPSVFSKNGNEYESTVQWMIKASRQGYWMAQGYLEGLFEKGKYLFLSDSTLLDFLVEVARFSERCWGACAKTLLKQKGWNIENLDNMVAEEDEE